MKQLTKVFTLIFALLLTACSAHVDTSASNLSEHDKQFIRDYEMAQYTFMDHGVLKYYSGEDIKFYPLNKNVVAIESSLYCDETSCTPQFYKRIDETNFCRVPGEFIRSADLVIEGSTSIKEDAIKQVLAAQCM